MEAAIIIRFFKFTGYLYGYPVLFYVQVPGWSVRGGGTGLFDVSTMSNILVRPRKCVQFTERKMDK